MTLLLIIVNETKRISLRFPYLFSCITTLRKPLRVSTTGCNKISRHFQNDEEDSLFLEAFAVYDTWARFVVLLFRDPHLLESG